MNDFDYIVKINEYPFSGLLFWNYPEKRSLYFATYRRKDTLYDRLQYLSYEKPDLLRFLLIKYNINLIQVEMFLYGLNYYFPLIKNDEGYIYIKIYLMKNSLEFSIIYFQEKMKLLEQIINKNKSNIKNYYITSFVKAFHNEVCEIKSFKFNLTPKIEDFYE